MEKMMIPLLETVLDPEGFVATTVDGQLRSDLIKLFAAKATGYRLWEESSSEPERHPLTPEIAEMLSRDRSGRWEFYGVQLYDRERLLFSASRQGTQLMLFHIAEERTKSAASFMETYDGVTKVKIYPMPEETAERWARRVV